MRNDEKWNWKTNLIKKSVYIYIYIRNNNQKNVNQIWYKIQIGPNDKEWKKIQNK
jgi:hypothetical protein